MSSQDKHVGPPSYFQNNDWVVNQYGIHNKAGNCDPVTWDEVKSFNALQVKTIHPFYIEPWPFRASTNKKKWFNQETYMEAFCYALGFITLKNYNGKALKHYVALYPNS